MKASSIRKYFKIYTLKYLAILFCLFNLSACGEPYCIAADDFGFRTFVVPARYSSDKIFGVENQTVPWINSKFNLNGDPLVIIVKNWDTNHAEESDKDNNKEEYVSAWCPWLGKNKDGKNALSAICSKLPDCEYKNHEMCNNPQIINKPCLMKKGVGLYGLIPDGDPNHNRFTMASPKGVSFHVGAPHPDYQLFDTDRQGKFKEVGGVRYTFSNQEKQQYISENKELYFKISDSDYKDNSGQYQVVIKSGIDSGGWDPIHWITTLVENKIFGINATRSSNGIKATKSNEGLVQIIFKKIVSNNNYKFTVNAVLILYITISGILFVIGSIQMTQIELVTRVIKVVIISQLLTGDAAWDFFHNYLFVLFIEGWSTLKDIVVHAGSSGSGGDTLISIMLAPETFKKLSSVLFVNWLGWLYIILYFLLLCFVFLVFFKATIIILSAELAVGLIIILAPIFLCFILFNFTMSIFQTWFKQLISFTLQPLILLTGLTFITVIIKHEIYASLGFTVCFQKIWDHSYSPSWWFPDVYPKSCSPNVTDTSTCVKKASILIPESFTREDDGKQCQAYECKGQRYPDLPYLNPANKQDAQRITDLRAGDGFVNKLLHLCILFILIYLLYKFNEFAISISSFIVGGGGQFSLKNTSKDTGAHLGKAAIIGTKAGFRGGAYIVKAGVRGGAYIVKAGNMVRRVEYPGYKQSFGSKGKDSLYSNQPPVQLDPDAKKWVNNLKANNDDKDKEN